MRKNLALKVTAVLTAILLWLLVLAKGGAEVTVEAPIVFEGLPPEVRAVDTGRHAVVRVRGHERLLAKLKKDQVRVVVDVGEEIAPGARRVPIDGDSVRVPLFLSAVDVKPDFIEVVVEPQGGGGGR